MTAIRKRGTAGIWRAPLAVLALVATHFLVDATASVVLPLWPSLQEELELPPGADKVAFVAWSIATSITQLAFGYAGDRRRGRWLVWLGPAVAVVCVGCVGMVTSAVALCSLLVLGGLGIAAFHPEGAARAGACLPEHRSRAVSLFVMGGFLGQAAGPAGSGLLTTAYGLSSLVWLVPGGLVALGALAPGLRVAPSTAGLQETSRLEKPKQASRNGLGRAAVVLAAGTLRMMPTLGIPLAVGYVLRDRGASNAQIGATQSMFMAGMGIGVFVCAVAVSRRSERAVLWALPLLIVPLQVLASQAENNQLQVIVAVCGFVLGATQPILIGYAQRLLAGTERTANALTMGVSWGLGGVLIAGALEFYQRMGRLEAVFYVFAASTLAACMVCFWLPSADSESSPESEKRQK